MSLKSALAGSNPPLLATTGPGSSSATVAPVLTARGITKELGEGAGRIMAVKGVDISLRPGELTLLMGPSGSGKTTLLSILGCILSPTSGTVEIDGTMTNTLSPEQLARLRRTHIGYIFQSYNLFPTLTALENVRIALDVAGFSSAAGYTRAEQALRVVGLEPKFKSYPANLSGGEKQRVAVARAIASAPSIVLADEPTAALDSENGHGVMKLLSEIARTQNRSILVVTHDPRTLAYADRVIRIEDGLIIGEDRGDHSALHAANSHAAPHSEPDAPPQAANSDDGEPTHGGPPTLIDLSPSGRRSKRRRKGLQKNTGNKKLA